MRQATYKQHWMQIKHTIMEENKLIWCVRSNGSSKLAHAQESGRRNVATVKNVGSFSEDMDAFLMGKSLQRRIWNFAEPFFFVI